MSGARSEFAYQAVYRYLCGLIEAVDSHPGQRLPALRVLARQLQVSIATVQAAYSLLEAQGRVYSVVKSGYYLSRATALEIAVDASADPLLQRMNACAAQARMSLLSQPAEPGLTAALQRRERELWRSGPCTQLADPCGEAQLRRALAARYSRSPGDCWHPDQVFVAADACAVLQALVLALGLKGATVLVSVPCAWPLLYTLRASGVQVLELPLCPRGRLDLEQLTRLLKAQPVRLVVLDSRVNWPQGTLMPLGQRQALARLFALHGTWLLENDSVGELCFKPAARLRELIDPERLLVFASLQPILGAEGAYGYLLARHFNRELRSFFLGRAASLAPLRQQAIGQLFDSGQVDNHLQSLRASLPQRLAEMHRSLAGPLREHLDYRLPAAGRALWVRSRRPVDMRQVFEQLLARRIVIAPGELFSLQGYCRQHLLLALPGAGVSTDAQAACWQALAEVLGAQAIGPGDLP